VRVAVTGASGFIGGWIARSLAARGHSVVSLGRRPPEELTGDLPNYRQWGLPGALEEPPAVDAVVHSAALVGQWGRHDAYRTMNVEGTRRVAETFAGVARFVHISSASVYAPTVDKHLVREDAPTGPPSLTAYSMTKAEAERIVRDVVPRAVILRPHIVYGPGDTTLLPRVKRAIGPFGVLPVPGNGRNIVSVTHVLNLVHAVECALRVEGASGAYNVADLTQAAVRELLETLLGRLGLRARLLFIPRGLAWGLAMASERLAKSLGSDSEPRLTRYVVANLADEYTLDVTRARAELGYQPKWDYKSGPLV
jgi:2-alkyl-3-oxoalkanoate reductase